MGVSTPNRRGIFSQVVLLAGAVVSLQPLVSCDRGYRFIASPADDVITLAPLSNGWRPVVSTASWRYQSTAGARHPVHSKVQQHLRADEARKRAQAAESNKVEVFAAAPPSILGSFSLVSKPRPRNKVAEQEQLLPQGRIVYSARLVPPPVQSSSASDGFSTANEPPHKRDKGFLSLTPPAKSGKNYYSRPSSLELFPSAARDVFSSQQVNFYPSKYEDPLSFNNYHSAFPASANTHNHGIYLDPSQNVHSSSLSSQQAFKSLPDSVQFFKDFFDKHKAAYAEALTAQKQLILEKQKAEPVIESVELGKEVFYGKDVNTNPFTNFNDYNGKFVSPFNAKTPSEVEIVHEKRPETGLYSTPAPENFKYNNLPVKGTNNYKYQVGVLTTPFSNPSHVYTSPTPLPLVQPTFPANNLQAPTTTFHPPIKNEFKLSPVQFLPPTSVTFQPQGENGRIPRPYLHDKKTNEKVPEVFSVTNGHAPPQHIPQKLPAVHNEKYTFVTFLPTVPPEIQTVVPDQGYEEGLTSPHSNVNEVTPIPGRGRVTFKQSPVDPLSSHTPLTSIDSFGIQKLNRPTPTSGYKEPDQTIFSTLKPDIVTYTSEVSTAEPTKDPTLSEVSRPHVKVPDRSRQRQKASRRPSTNSGSPEQKEFQRQRNPQRTRQSSDSLQHVQNQQHKYLSSSPIGTENGFESDHNMIPPRNHRPYTETDLRGNDMVINDGVKQVKTEPIRNRRPTAHQSENDYSEESQTEDNLPSSTQSYYTRGPDAQKLVRENYDEETDVKEQSEEKVQSSRRPSSQTRYTTRPQHGTRNNEQAPTRSPLVSRRRPQTQRDNPGVRESDSYRLDQNFGYQGTRTHHPRRPSSTRSQVSYYTTNNEYDGTRGRPSHRQRPTKHEMTDTTEVEEEPERQTETTGSQKHRNQASYGQAETDGDNAYVHYRRRKPATENYNYDERQEETLLNQPSNDDIQPDSPAVTNELTSQIYSTTTRPTRRYPSTQRLNKDRYNVPSSTHSAGINDLPVTSLPSHNTDFTYDQAESYEHSDQTNYKIRPDNTLSINHEHKNAGKGKNAAPTKASASIHEDADELSSEFTTTLEPVQTSVTSSTTTTTYAPTTTAPTTTTTSATTTSSTTTSTAAASVLPPTTTDTEPSPTETSTAASTSTSTDTHSPLYSPLKLRPRLRPANTNSSRPRFSIKDYRQRLNKQNEDESQDDKSDNNDDEKSSASHHARYPSRTRGSESYRRDPSGSTSTTTEASRTRYRSGDRPRTSTRFRTTSSTTNRPDHAASTEKGGFRPSTSRFKPGSSKFYSRYRSSTPPSADKSEDEESGIHASSTTPRIVMNSRGVFSAMRRIYPLKMLTSGQKNATAKEEPVKLGASDVVHTLPPTFVITPQSTSSSSTEPSTTERANLLTATLVDDHTPERHDVKSNRTVFQNSHSGMESVFSSGPREDEKANLATEMSSLELTPTPSSVELQSPSQIVAGLTSAGTASGYFKSATSLSPRPALRITMATEDPRLPIEAFFPVLSGRD